MAFDMNNVPNEVVHKEIKQVQTTASMENGPPGNWQKPYWDDSTVSWQPSKRFYQSSHSIWYRWSLLMSIRQAPSYLNRDKVRKRKWKLLCIPLMKKLRCRRICWSCACWHSKVQEYQQLWVIHDTLLNANIAKKERFHPVSNHEDTQTAVW